VVPPSAERRYVPDEVLVEIPARLTPTSLQGLERRLGLTLIASRDFPLIDAKVNRYRVAKPRTVAQTVQALRAGGQVDGAQPNYLFALQEDAPATPEAPASAPTELTPPPLPAALTPPPLPAALMPPPLPSLVPPPPPTEAADDLSRKAPAAAPARAASTSEPGPAPASAPAPAATPAPQPAPAADAEPPSDSPQYTIAAMHLREAHRVATGKGVRVAIIDSGVDADCPEIAGRIVARYDAVGGTFRPHPHGTAIAGAILAHSKLMGVAPDAEVIAIRAFTGEGKGSGAEGTSFQILDGLQFAAAQKARVVNMSFAGAHDAMLARALRKLRAQGVAEIAAAGNGGAKSDPLYPGAEPGVIAVTATDQHGQLFEMANRGPYIAIAAPGVDILLPAPGDAVQVASGTSIAAAEVTGIAALALQRYGSLTPDALISALGAGARMPDPAASAEDYGAGVIDAYGVVSPKAGASAGTGQPIASAAPQQ
jgi:subtilisin family serine protease